MDIINVEEDIKSIHLIEHSGSVIMNSWIENFDNENITYHEFCFSSGPDLYVDGIPYALALDKESGKIICDEIFKNIKRLELLDSNKNEGHNYNKYFIIDFKNGLSKEYKLDKKILKVFTDIEKNFKDNENEEKIAIDRYYQIYELPEQRKYEEYLKMRKRRYLLPNILSGIAFCLLFVCLVVFIICVFSLFKNITTDLILLFCIVLFLIIRFIVNRLYININKKIK